VVKKMKKICHPTLPLWYRKFGITTGGEHMFLQLQQSINHTPNPNITQTARPNSEIQFSWTRKNYTFNVGTLNTHFRFEKMHCVNKPV